VVRRVRVRAADISTDPQARCRRTIPKDQLTLALDGLVEDRIRDARHGAALRHLPSADRTVNTV
jgi:hypothetical protein